MAIPLEALAVPPTSHRTGDNWPTHRARARHRRQRAARRRREERKAA